MAKENWTGAPVADTSRRKKKCSVAPAAIPLSWKNVATVPAVGLFYGQKRRL